MTIVSNPDAKNRERARLSNLFERLSTRLPQPSVSSDVTNSSQHPRAEEFRFSTVLRNLSVIRTSCESDPRARRKTVAFTSSSGSSGAVTPLQGNDDEGDFDEFQLAEEKKYPFTFKHMIHKLYKKDDWLRTVREVLEKSKKDFKSLAENDLKQSPSELIDPHVLSNSKRGSTIVRGRESWKMSTTVVDEPSTGGESLRALKKRCVCKSISRKPSSDGDQDLSFTTKESGNEATFVFASTISSTERPGTEIYLHFPSPQVSPSDSCFSDAGQDITAPHSPVSPITPISPVSLYTTGCAAGVKRRVGMNHQIVMLKAVPPSRLAERNFSKLSRRFSQNNKDLE